MDDAIDDVSLSEHEGDSGVESTNSADSMLYIRIAVPDLNVQVRYISPSHLNLFQNVDNRKVVNFLLKKPSFIVNGNFSHRCTNLGLYQFLCTTITKRALAIVIRSICLSVTTRYRFRPR